MLIGTTTAPARKRRSKLRSSRPRWEGRSRPCRPRGRPFSSGSLRWPPCGGQVADRSPTSSNPNMQPSRAAPRVAFKQFGHRRDQFGVQHGRSTSDHAEPAADADHLAGDPAAGIGRKQRHHRRDVGRLAKPPDRIGLDQLVAVGIDPGLVMRSLDQAERDRVGRSRRSGPISRASDFINRDRAGARSRHRWQGRIRRPAMNRP